MDMNNGQDLRDWRKKNHITQDALAEMIDYNKSRICHIETGNEILSKKIRDAILRVDARINPKDDCVINAWRELKTYGQGPIKDEVDSLITTLPVLLSPKVGDVDTMFAYMEFLSRVVKDLLRIRNGSSYVDDNSYKNEIIPIIQDINKASRRYLKVKASSKLDMK